MVKDVVFFRKKNQYRKQIPSTMNIYIPIIYQVSLKLISSDYILSSSEAFSTCLALNALPLLNDQVAPRRILKREPQPSVMMLRVKSSCTKSRSCFGAMTLTASQTKVQLSFTRFLSDTLKLCPGLTMALLTFTRVIPQQPKSTKNCLKNTVMENFTNIMNS